MKKTISYEKDIIFKTAIGEICSISLEHDFTVDDMHLKGDFIVSGDYKTNELSVNKEAFSYRLPLDYELEPTIDLSTLSYDVENFEYNVDGDELSVYIDFGVRYEEKSVEPVMPEAKELEVDEIKLDEFLKDEDEREDDKVDEVELPRLNEEEKSVIIEGATGDDTYVTYHVHIVRENETLESIALKYNVSTETIKEYNDVENLGLKSKLIIPETTNE